MCWYSRWSAIKTCLYNFLLFKRIKTKTKRNKSQKIEMEQDLEHMRGLLDIKYCADYKTIKRNTMQDTHTNKTRSMLERKVMCLVTYEPMCVSV